MMGMPALSEHARGLRIDGLGRRGGGIVGAGDGAAEGVEGGLERFAQGAKAGSVLVDRFERGNRDRQMIGELLQ